MLDLAALWAAFDRYLLVLVRVTGFLGATPFFGSRAIPAPAKMGLGLSVAFFLLPSAHWAGAGVSFDTPGAYSLAVGSELLVGLALGFALTIALSALQVAGQMIDIPIGFSLVNVIDPAMGQQVPVIGQFQYILFMLMFLAINGHHQFLMALARTFEVVPLGGFQYFPGLPALLLKGFSAAFLLGFQIGLPVVAALFLTDIGLGLVARAVPQMNVFVVGFPAKIIVGLLFITLVLPVYATFVEAALGPHSAFFGLIDAIVRGGAAGAR
ncbi:MAG: flagellar biosynthetic protein FliR [Chitinophagales bacterium]